MTLSQAMTLEQPNSIIRKGTRRGTAVEIGRVAKLELTALGKQGFVVSEVDVDDLAGMESEVQSGKGSFSRS